MFTNSNLYDSYQYRIQQRTRCFSRAFVEFGALSEATFHIPQGNLVVLSGNRGSGKKTVLELMAGVVGTTRAFGIPDAMSTCSSKEQIQT